MEGGCKHVEWAGMRGIWYFIKFEYLILGETDMEKGSLSFQPFVPEPWRDHPQLPPKNKAVPAESYYHRFCKILYNFFQNTFNFPQDLSSESKRDFRARM